MWFKFILISIVLTVSISTFIFVFVFVVWLLSEFDLLNIQKIIK